MPQVLELGSGTGLAGIFASILFPNSKVFLTDICLKSIRLIKENVALNNNTTSFDWSYPNYFEWGNFERNNDID